MRAHLTVPVLLAAALLVASSAMASAGERTCAPTTAIPDDGPPIAITSWLVCGPFPSPELADRDPSGAERAGFDTDFLTALGGESTAHPCSGETVAIPDGRTVRFTPHQWSQPYADLNQVFQEPGEVCAYLYAELESPVDQVAYLHLGTNAAGKAWVGNQLVVSHPHDRVAMKSQNVAQVRLSAGRTRLLVKVDHDGGGWGAFAEIYGREAHRAFVREKTPRNLMLEADTYVSAGGDTIRVRIANWIPPVDVVRINWTIFDGVAEHELQTVTPEVRVPVSAGAGRTLRVQARSRHPRGGESLGECVVLCGGEPAARRAFESFASLTPPDSPGPRHDAYALALYAVERAQRDIGEADLSESMARVGKQAARLRLALDQLAAGVDPYAGRVGTFDAVYLSKADGTAQPLTVVVPHTYPAEGPYALFVNLHGASFTHELTGDWAPSVADSAYEDGTIIISVMGRGRHSGYEGLGEIDVLDAIDWATTHFRIDPDRVFIRGGSMGGMGTWRLASLYPDRFAGAWVDCGSPPLSTYRNLLNLPTWVNHGDEDWSVPITGARIGVGLMRDAGCRVTYKEYPGVDHAVGVAVGPEGYMTRLASHRRIGNPAHITITAEHPRYATQYWGSISEWGDPHTAATLDAQVREDGSVEIATSNVTRAVVTPPLPAGRSAVTMVVNGTRLSVPRSPDGAYDVDLSGGSARVTAHTARPAPEVRPYAPGSTMNLYRGEPLLVVYGTQGNDTALIAAMRSLADEASHWSGPSSVMEYGTVSTLPDSLVPDEHLCTHNLILIGGPGENSVTASIMSEMPVREEAGSLQVLDAETIPLDGRGYGFVRPNPLHPDRLVLVYASSEPAYYTLRRGRLLGWDVANADPNGADLVVEDVPPVAAADDPRVNRLVRQVWFTHGWQPAPASDRVIGRHPANALELAEMCGAAFRSVTGADYALVQRASAANPCPYDTATVRWGDRPVDTPDLVVFDATGTELQALADASEGSEWMPLLMPTPDAVDPDRTYRVAGSFRAVSWASGGARMNPRNARLFEDGQRVEDELREVFEVKEEE